MKILVASTNPHKLEEIAAIFEAERKREPAGASNAAHRRAFELVSLAALGREIPEAVENAPTFEGNALKKARHYADASGLATIADDSGLEVDTLGGAPGVLSARYSGATGPRREVDLENNRRLLRELEGVPIDKRAARFVCAMAFVAPRRSSGSAAPGLAESGSDQTCVIVRGIVEGRILLPAECADPAQPWRGRGLHGFGYDPLFLISSLGRTTAELDADHKNSLSHRGHAARLLWPVLSGVLCEL